MKLENITDVFFDLDHTLWDFEKNSNVAFQTIFTNHQLLYALDDFLMAYPAINYKYWELYRNNKITHNQLRYARLKDSFDAINVSINDDKIEQLATDYITELPQSNHLIEGTLAILDYLQPKYNLHIITNGLHEVQRSKITSAKLTDYFKTITDSESTGAKKPSATIYNYALQQAQCEPQHAVMIGDCIDADFNGAKKAGLQAILFDEFNAFTELEIGRINNLVELKKYL
ncbi:YjjG family noncanonical pyrimidine nucleotidase [Flavobacterium agricola]|uniref:YjjG family noncanonical pyrimidine nucleotidase n=1 Tax=Flavobacterium agricola TaxID=2870839 RepID=A0ABY6M1L2_9FLAO|nr:YjjG family noncanonical pyrimidine nucleotidase [Flavobacterium agricola]UYW01539.1 YjjG family noncanonical pyrimidine nucleotidase [Flavobacterium agricola]